MKKLALFLAVLMLCSAFSATALAATIDYEDGTFDTGNSLFDDANTAKSGVTLSAIVELDVDFIVELPATAADFGNLLAAPAGDTKSLGNVGVWGVLDAGKEVEVTVASLKGFKMTLETAPDTFTDSVFAAYTLSDTSWTFTDEDVADAKTAATALAADKTAAESDITAAAGWALEEVTATLGSVAAATTVGAYRDALTFTAVYQVTE